MLQAMIFVGGWLGTGRNKNEKLTISLFISSGYARQLISENGHKQNVKPVTRSSTFVK